MLALAPRALRTPLQDGVAAVEETCAGKTMHEDGWQDGARSRLEQVDQPEDAATCGGADDGAPRPVAADSVEGAEAERGQRPASGMCSRSRACDAFDLLDGERLDHSAPE